MMLWPTRKSAPRQYLSSGVLADPHPEGRQALPLLCQPDGAEAWARCLSDRKGAGGRDRGRRHRPAPRRLPPARGLVGTWRAARGQDDAITEAEVQDALLQLDPLWDEIFPAEQTRIVQLLVERVEIAEDGLDIRLRTDGLAGLVREFGVDARAAA